MLTGLLDHMEAFKEGRTHDQQNSPYILGVKDATDEIQNYLRAQGATARKPSDDTADTVQSEVVSET